VPGAAVPALVVRVGLPPAATEVELRFAVAPAGAPLTERLTVPALPEVTAVLIVLVPDEPWTTESVDGVAAIEKSLVTVPPQPGNLNEAIRVFQLNDPLAGMYSLVNQNVQSSLGSTAVAL
jgi:hypothetical protein